MNKDSLADFIGRCATSDFAYSDNFVELTSEVQGVYYRCKNSWGRLIADDTLKDLLLYGLDKVCFGDVEYLESQFIEEFGYFLRINENYWHLGDCYSLSDKDLEFFALAFNRGEGYYSEVGYYTENEKFELEELIRHVLIDMAVFSNEEIVRCFNDTVADQEIRDSERAWNLHSGFAASVLMTLTGKVARSFAGFDNTAMNVTELKDIILGIDYSIVRGMQVGGLMVSGSEAENAELLYEMGQKAISDSYYNAKRLLETVKKSLNVFCNNTTLDEDIYNVEEFLRGYRPLIKPQDDDIVLTYPVLVSYDNLIGIEKVETFLKCVLCEENYLNQYPVMYLKTVMRKCEPAHEVSIFNVFETIIRHEFETDEMDIEITSNQVMNLENVKEWLETHTANQLCDRLFAYFKGIEKESDADAMMSAYMDLAAKNYIKQLKTITKMK